MKYINKSLSIEKVKIQDVVKKFGTPTYCYSYEQLKKNITIFKKTLDLLAH
jgi:diaminopimelate decarboxylase